MRLVFVLLIFSAQQAIADDRGDRWKAFYEGIAKRYTIEARGEQPSSLTLSNYPALVWSNPARAGDTHGAFWIWTRDGRPEAVGTIFSYLGGADSRVVAHEFHSLSQSPLVAQLDGHTVWTPSQAGVEWKSLTETSEPGSNRARRLLEMRKIAREFVVTAQNEVEQAEGEQLMRLLPQPLYRYETSEDGIDGCLFTFVLGTDPECLLLIESDPQSKGWRVAMARFTHLSFRVERDGKKLFEHIRGNESERDASFRYVCFRNGSAPLDPPEISDQ